MCSLCVRVPRASLTTQPQIVPEMFRFSENYLLELISVVGRHRKDIISLFSVWEVNCVLR